MNNDALTNETPVTPEVTVKAPADWVVANTPKTGPIICEVKHADGTLIGMFTLPAKEFKTGSKGYYSNGKVEVNGKRYQAQLQLVEIGSKKAAE